MFRRWGDARVALESLGKDRKNNIGAFRLILACAVIVSHSPQLLGLPSHELLTQFGSEVSLGAIAVDGFFILSGYLIAGSYLSKNDAAQFLFSRIRRIYPGFIAASAVCIIAVAPLSGSKFPTVGELITSLGRSLILLPPEASGAFHTLKFQALNGAMWSIRYEFRCYMLVLLLGILGLLSNRRVMMLITTSLITLLAFRAWIYFPIPKGEFHRFVFGVFGDPEQVIRLNAIFLSGACFRLLPPRVLNPRAAGAAALVTIFAVIFTQFGEVAMATTGSYALLWAALKLKSRILETVNSKNDISYGTYLYAWPIASLLILEAQGAGLPISPFQLTIITTILAMLAGAISWFLIESPAMQATLAFKWPTPMRAGRGAGRLRV